jgi:hypothetical protein
MRGQPKLAEGREYVLSLTAQQLARSFDGDPRGMVAVAKVRKDRVQAIVPKTAPSSYGRAPQSSSRVLAPSPDLRR